MENQTPLTKSSLPLWVESYPTGYINMKNQEVAKFKPDVLKYDYAAETTKKIIKSGNNLGIKIPSPMTKRIIKTKPLNYENFSNELDKINDIFVDHKELFILPRNHVNPIWIIISFLIFIWIIYFLSK